ncbi:MAG: RagB/SusD family nutrient uptake outer membrane protein [Bacteroidales bacterium]|nr:RagB/SusD family nutrient uptake outer membrane protein [Bacteroidales bacterium]
MKTKHIYKIFIVGAILMSAYACSLDKDPLSEYSEVTYGQTTSTDSIKYKTKGEMYSQYQALYQKLKDRQEHWYLDLMLIAEAHSDNAYAGTTGSEVMPMENNSVDGGNSVLARDWDRYLADVAQANTVVENIDKVPDQTLTQAERKQWKAEAKIFRAMVWFDMIRIWGNIPVVTKEGVDITAENIEEVYPLYYPEQTPVVDAYAQIIKDLTEGIADAPANNAADKTMLSKSVAKALLAKVYAEKPARDYGKVLEYCNAVIADGFSLVSNYADLFSLNSAGTDAKVRSTSESILEVNYFTGGGNWVTWMFGKDLLNPETNFTWAKWVTPSRDLINAFTTEGDNIRLNQSVVYYATTWSNYYPSSNYPFMYKCRSAASSIIKIRLADILLLKAEALANLGGSANIEAAVAIVNQVRRRVSLPDLASSASASKESLLNAILHERRLELAFEGQRWFDLVRYGKVQEIMNSLNTRDSGRLPLRRTFTDVSELLPIPSTVLDLNTNLKQNPGY